MSDSASPTRKRASIRFGETVTRALHDGHGSGGDPRRSDARRLEAIAARYLSLLAPPTWPAESWAAAIRAARRIDLTSPGAPWAILGLARAERMDTRLTVALESLTPPQAWGMVSVVERFLATGQEPTVEAVTATLPRFGVTLS
jgi:hypothetical protein